MDTILINSLKQLGCDEKHVRLYRASLQLGAVGLPELARAARLQRSTAYLIAADMVRLGLLEEDHKTYRKQYVAVEPDVILRKLEAKHRQLGRVNLALKEALPELRAAQQSKTSRPRVRTFEGKAGLLAVWKDILLEKQEVLLWTNQANERQIFDSAAHETFIAERIAKQIPLRALAVDNPQAQLLVKSDASSLRTTKLLPAQVDFTSETYVYGNKVAVLDVGRDIFGVITENEQIANSQRTLFELLWSSN